MQRDMKAGRMAHEVVVGREDRQIAMKREREDEGVR